MNRYFFVRRLTGPSILLLLGIVALLHQAHLVHFSIFVPLLLILLGVLKLAERVVIANEPSSAWPYPGAPAAPGMPPTPGAVPGSMVPPPDASGRERERGML